MEVNEILMSIMVAAVSGGTLGTIVTVVVNSKAQKEASLRENDEKKKDREYQWLVDEVRSLKEEITELRKLVNSKDETIAEKERTILSQQHTIEDLKEEVEYQKKKKEKYQAELENLKGGNTNG